MELRDYQSQAIDAVFNYWCSEPGNPILVAPTGAGKAVMLAEIARRLVEGSPHRHILVLAHRKELVSQNAEKFIRLAPGMDVGVYSAGLGIKKIRRVTFAGIQSVWKKAKDFGYQSLVMIDECHLLSKKSTGMYQTFLKDLRSTNPRLKVFGCSATPFRLDSGSLIGDDQIFSDIAHEIDLRELIDGGWLAPLKSKSSKVAVNLDGVKVRGGDFVGSELEWVMNEAQLVDKACKEIVTRSDGRRSWLIFCSGVDHTRAVRDKLRELGQAAEMVLGDTWEMERDRLIAEFKERGGCLCNCDVLTTGFDAPAVDLIALLRPTKSAGLFIQMCGRGMRTAIGKSDCLVLDFGGNIERFGPIDTIKIKHKKNQKSEIKKAVIKKCPECDEWCPAAARECKCGYEFPPPALNHSAIPTVADILSQQKIEEFEVESIDYAVHNKEGKPPSLKVTYYIGNGVVWPKFIREFVCLEHGGFATKRAQKWWRERAREAGDTPTSTSDALRRAGEGELKSVDKVKAVLEGKFWRILKVEMRKEEAEIDTLEVFGVNI